ncbi:unnamed protein product [Adineta steineri]|uniref:Uncharacterized protein n=3 Tax=Adineta steineri TaxID=433720 RepID=A0A813R0S5_9BILA|nr:unnamed protein product [Adineta steineri]
MTTNRSVYENMDDESESLGIWESIYLNPSFIDDDDSEKIKSSLIHNKKSTDTSEQSPYLEVANNVSNKDDPSILCLTFRSIFIGILLTCLMAFTVQFFALRTSPLDVNTGIIILISYLFGKLMAAILPTTICNITINPGPFSIKEHTLIVIMASSGSRTYEAMEALLGQRLYYNYNLTHINSILFLLIMHFLAISISGILKRYLVWPASMMWPSTLVSCSLIRTLMDESQSLEEETRWKMSRSKFFWLIVLFQFLWYWLPGYIFPLLSAFSFVCMIAPTNRILSQVTGASGLGFGAIELDWNAWVAFLESPILVPFWAHINIFVGFIIAIWIGTPIIYYFNIWESQKAPIISNRVFDSDGYYYSTAHVLNKDLHLNATANKVYGEAYLSAGYAVSFCFMFAGMSALIIHTILYHGNSIVDQFRSSISDKKNDVHAKLMSSYPQISDWCYYIMLLVTLFVAFIFCYFTESLPWKGVLFSIILTLIFTLPSGIITATTNMTLTTTIAGDFLCAILLPGNPIGFLTFRTYTNTCLNQIIIYLTNLKIGHYMKIPPRIMFPAFILSAIISSIVHYLVGIYLLYNVPNICTSKNHSWRCLHVENTYTASIIFGVAGLFKPGSRYFPILLAFPIGFILPMISWYLYKKYPSTKWLALINFPILLLSTTNLPPAPTVTFPSWFLVGFIFNFILYRHASNWWQKYAYIFSAAMSCGVAICGFCIFFLFENQHIHFPQWWGLGGPTGDGCPLASANYSGSIPIERDL